MRLKLPPTPGLLDYSLLIDISPCKHSLRSPIDLQGRLYLRQCKVELIPLHTKDSKLVCEFVEDKHSSQSPSLPLPSDSSSRHSGDGDLAVSMEMSCAHLSDIRSLPTSCIAHTRLGYIHGSQEGSSTRPKSRSVVPVSRSKMHRIQVSAHVVIVSRCSLATTTAFGHLCRVWLEADL